MKHFIDFNKDLTIQQAHELLALARDLKCKQKEGVSHALLAGKSLGMIFSKSSTRTRVAFEVGMYQLGGQALFLNPQDIQLGRGETIHDTAKVLSRMLDGIMIRTFAHQDVLDLAQYGSIPVINGLTDEQHPTQVLADLLTILEHKGDFKGLKMAYVGDINNVVHSLIHASAKVGINLAVASPDVVGADHPLLLAVADDSKQTGAKITIINDPKEAVLDADVVYTDTWVSMGQEHGKEERLAKFVSYQVSDALMALAKKDAIFMHCLPAYRGYEVATSVIDGTQSVVFDQSENRLHAHKAILVYCLFEGTTHDKPI